jgi:hypothetical protein
MRLYILLFISVLFSTHTIAQQAADSTAEEALALNLLKKTQVATPIGGYGELRYSYDAINKTAATNLDRAVIFMGHKFNNKISFFSEIEIEDAKIAGGEAGGEISLEQAFARFVIKRNTFLYAGLFIPRIGIINENHLPTTFNGVNRPFVETLVLPSTWREIGIGLYGNIKQVNGLQYTLALTNGLNSAGFENGSGIRGARFEGKNASAANLATSGSLLYYINNFRFQLSGYVGGSAGLTHKVADSLQLSSGAFGTPVMLSDFNIQYNKNAWSIKALAAAISIPDAKAINAAYTNNTPEMLMGSYVEVAYNILYHSKKYNNKKFNLFARYENIDLNAKTTENGIHNNALQQQYLIAGFTFQPVVGIIIKADYLMKQTGNWNQALITLPFPQQNAYQTKKSVLNLGIGYSF